jgi:hypothetical protein
MRSLLDELVQTERRETAGGDTSARFDYQKGWALCELLTRHHAGDDYLVAFEFHDDILFLTPELAPASVDFVQVKTSKAAAPRTLASITKKSSGGSVIGKMVANTAIVPEPFQVRLILVSNNHFEFSATSVAAARIAEPYRKKLIGRLKEEFPQSDLTVLERLHFFVSEIPVDEMETFLKGKVVELFEDRFGPNFTENILSWLRLVQGEIKRKNNYPDEKIGSVADLIKHKCLGRSFIAQTLDEIESAHRVPPDLTLVKGALLEEGWSLVKITRMDKKIPRALADYNDPSNLECKGIAEEIRKIIKGLDLTTAKLSEVLDVLFDKIDQATKIPLPYRDVAFIGALGLLIYYEEL